jgi:hypothetical protein
MTGPAVSADLATLSALQDRMNALLAQGKKGSPEEWRALKKSIEEFCAALATLPGSEAQAFLPAMADMVTGLEAELQQRR